MKDERGPRVSRATMMYDHTSNKETARSHFLYLASKRSKLVSSDGHLATHHGFMDCRRMPQTCTNTARTLALRINHFRFEFKHLWAPHI